VLQKISDGSGSATKEIKEKIELYLVVGILPQERKNFVLHTV
jgi:hypothetical protein